MASFLKVIDEAMRAAVWTKFKSTLGFNESDEMGDNIVLAPKDIAWKMISSKEGRQHQRLEFMNVYRTETNFSWKRQRTPLARRGIPMNYTDSGVSDSGSLGDSDSFDRTGIDAIKAVPADMNYSAWFWTQNLEIMNELTELIMFWIHNTPYLSVSYNDLFPLELNISPIGTIEESPLINMFEIGQYYVLRADLNVEGWVFSDINVKTIKSIHVKIYDKDEISNLTEFINDPNDTLELYSEVIT